ncbi:hypothetical protein L2E82_11639 [Cichorium intybus]|uniref:Uncharacterized protein n=1 Tax=Cichorium intybus TaxID=13427 RepID=A0ACB9GDV8_CICIN|nr:hypothetical protein L2E82_11639 [Cichorium intybus]
MVLLWAGILNQSFQSLEVGSKSEPRQIENNHDVKTLSKKLEEGFLIINAKEELAIKDVSQKVSPNSEVMAVKSGKKAGMVTTGLGSRGLGLLRLEEAFKGKSEECAANEERQLLEKVAELLVVSNARKKELVTSSVNVRLLEPKDSNKKFENGKKNLNDVLQNCLQKVQMGSQQWSKDEESLLTLEKSNIASVDEIVRLWINNSKDNKEGYSNTSGSRGTEDLLAKDVNA